MTFEFEGESPLRDVLFAQGLEFPCGGRGRCRRCKVRVVEGRVPVTAAEADILTSEDLAAGWRLGCRAQAIGRVTLEAAQWQTPILADDSAFHFTPQEGLGVAVDIGTTTLVAQLVNLHSGRVLGVRSALNPQAVFGADVMSRVESALTAEGARRLRDLIRAETGRMVAELTPAPRRVMLVGNTVMHHLFCGVDVEPLARCPFEPSEDGLRIFEAAELGWEVDGPVAFLPCLGGFVGSDILAGILATRMHESNAPAALIDLGTNGEIVVGNRRRILCASTAAGPAFEGGRIGMGMRAATGAVAEVTVCGGQVQCEVLGHARPRGICGSGLVDAAAAGLELGLIQPSGRLARGRWDLCPPVTLTQADIRELQLAKGAVAAGLRMLQDRWAAPVERLYLAGAFGNYVNRASARRIGLIDFPPDEVQPAGNTALLGAKIALFMDDGFEDLRARVEHVPLASDPSFQDRYVAEMSFPVRAV